MVAAPELWRCPTYMKRGLSVDSLRWMVVFVLVMIGLGLGAVAVGGTSMVDFEGGAVASGTAGAVEGAVASLGIA